MCLSNEAARARNIVWAAARVSSSFVPTTATANTPQWAEGMFELAMHAACLPWGCFGYGPSRPTQAEVRHPWEPLHEGGGALRATKQRLRLGFASSGEGTQRSRTG